MNTFYVLADQPREDQISFQLYDSVATLDVQANVHVCESAVMAASQVSNYAIPYSLELDGSNSQTISLQYVLDHIGHTASSCPLGEPFIELDENLS